MGIIGHFSSSSHDQKSCSIFSHWKSASSFDVKLKSSKPIIPNPSPENYTILRHLNIKRFLIIELQYNDCTNYEGKKILVFENVTLEQLTDQKNIDPHFSENNNFHSPIARFVPNDEGRLMALVFCRELKRMEDR